MENQCEHLKNLFNECKTAHFQNQKDVKSLFVNEVQKFNCIQLVKVFNDNCEIRNNKEYSYFER